MIAILMAVVNIRIMRMFVAEGLMNVKMIMRFAAIPIQVMLVLMMGIVSMPMAVGECFMNMFVFVTFGQMQPDSHRHQDRRQPKPV